MSGRVLALDLHDTAAAARRDVQVDHVVLAGWTGRDRAAVQKHIDELAHIGVKPPATTPIFYRVSAARLTTDDTIEAIGEGSGGEVEFILLRHDGRLWVGTGSDHTDRDAEKHGITLSKQMCDKPIATTFWAFEDLAGHWDRLILRAHVTEGARRVLYQEGTLAQMIDAPGLMSRYAAGGRLGEGTMMFGGALPTIGPVRATDRFDFELEDPVLGRKIGRGYRVVKLPVHG
jgi:Protein of unknown function (DUF2848)